MIVKLAMYLPIDNIINIDNQDNIEIIAIALLAMKMMVVKKNVNLSLAIILGFYYKIL